MPSRHRNNPTLGSDLSHLSRDANLQHSRSPSLTTDSLYSPAQFSDQSDRTSLSSVDDVRPSRTLTPGVYVPTLAFFHPETEDLDFDTIAAHAVRLARAGVTGLCTQGSNGEAVHLSTRERCQVTQTTRKALDDAGFHRMPLIVGCGAQSTRETIALCRDAFSCGGDFALILPPAYYKPLYDADAITSYFTAVADASPIPVLIYNYPAVATGTDLTSDTIIALAKHPNIVGCKLTCGNTGKLARIAAATDALTPSPKSHEQSQSATQRFICMGGSADFTLQTLIAGGSGVICGAGNIAPRACSQLLDLYATGQVAKAQEMQKVVARGDWACIREGIVGTKLALEKWFGYGGYGRAPLPRVESQKEKERVCEGSEEMVELEMKLLDT